LSAQIQEALLGLLHKETYPKKTLLFKEGNICDKVYFIEKGVARAFYYKQEQEITAWFMQENDLILSVSCFFKQKPSYESIELLEDTTLYSISYSHLQHMYKRFPEFNLFWKSVKPYIEDDYDNEFHFGQRPILPVSSYENVENYVYIGTMSKIVAPALRIGYLIS
jgi:signal-transduction protein with cAMP-binding, CBS, and nucleotidyltransferase domain